ncbi:MAG TPA: hypothetical protein VJ724_13930, partial [Tahibacter sp.]|nr:hypothetical protein [Tahibacter sp.]
MRHAFIVGLAFATFAASVAAQEEKLETIVVTGSRIGYRDLLDTPAVSIRRPGDWLLLGVALVNDTRNETARRDEMHATIRKMVAAAGKRFQLVYGDTFPTVIGPDGEQIPLDKDDKRPDVSRAKLFVRASIGGDPSRAEAITRDLRDFVAGAERVG